MRIWGLPPRRRRGGRYVSRLAGRSALRPPLAGLVWAAGGPPLHIASPNGLRFASALI